MYPLCSYPGFWHRWCGGSSGLDVKQQQQPTLSQSEATQTEIKPHTMNRSTNSVTVWSDPNWNQTTHNEQVNQLCHSLKRPKLKSNHTQWTGQPTLSQSEATQTEIKPHTMNRSTNSVTVWSDPNWNQTTHNEQVNQLCHSLKRPKLKSNHTQWTGQPTLSQSEATQTEIKPHTMNRSTNSVTVWSDPNWNQTTHNEQVNQLCHSLKRPKLKSNHTQWTGQPTLSQSEATQTEIKPNTMNRSNSRHALTAVAQSPSHWFLSLSAQHGGWGRRYAKITPFYEHFLTGTRSSRQNEAWTDLPWKGKKGPLWTRWTLQLVQRQHWQNF